MQAYKKNEMKKTIIVLLLIGLFLSSCVPTKDLTYFQGSPEKNTNVRKVKLTPYRLQVNDIIDIKIKAINQEAVSLFINESMGSANLRISPSRLYFESYSVDRNGMIRIPYLNEINVLGYTIKEVRIKIENELARMFKNMDDVFVIVKLAGIRYTILGEVKSTGVNVLFQNQVTLIEVIANAGDIKATGNRRKVTVIRTKIDGQKKFELDLTGFDYIHSDGFYIQPNDIIYIEPIKQKSWGTGLTGMGTIANIATSLSLVTTIIVLTRYFSNE